MPVIAGHLNQKGKKRMIFDNIVIKGVLVFFYFFLMNEDYDSVS